MIKATANLGSSISVTAQLKSVQTGSCADATYTNSDGSYAGSIASGDNLPIPDTGIHSSSSNYNDSVSSADPAGYEISDVVWTDSDGSPMVTEFGQPIICTAAAGATLTIGVFSDAGLTNPITSADFNDSFFIHLTTDLDTPTTYRFFVGTAADAITITEQAGATLEWTVSSFNDLTIFAESENGTIAACALNAFTVTVNADADANAFIAAHNALSLDVMASHQQQVMQETFIMMKGNNSTAENIHAFFASNGVRIFPYTPVSDSVVNIAAYGLDMIQLEEQTFHGYAGTDFTVSGVKGGSGKYSRTGMFATDFDLDNIGGDVYCTTSSSSSSIEMSFGSLDGGNYNAVGFALWPRWSNAISANVNSRWQAGGDSVDGLGLLSIQRNNSANMETLQNGVVEGILTKASDSIPSLEIYGGAVNSTSGAIYNDTRQHAWLCPARPSMTAAQMTAYNEVVDYYQSNIITGGRNV